MACGVVLALASCTPAQRKASLLDNIAGGVRAAHEGVNASRDAFTESARIAEGTAVNVARALGGTPEEVEARGLAALRAIDDMRGPALSAFAVAYAALARAESLIGLVREGKRDPVALVQAAMEVARAAEVVYAAVKGSGK